LEKGNLLVGGGDLDYNCNLLIMKNPASNYIGKCQSCGEKDCELESILIKDHQFLFCELCRDGSSTEGASPELAKDIEKTNEQFLKEKGLC